jgi:hypothetical protein
MQHKSGINCMEFDFGENVAMTVILNMGMLPAVHV